MKLLSSCFERMMKRELTLLLKKLLATIRVLREPMMMMMTLRLEHYCCHSKYLRSWCLKFDHNEKANPLIPW